MMNDIQKEKSELVVKITALLQEFEINNPQAYVNSIDIERINVTSAFEDNHSLFSRLRIEVKIKD